MLFLEKSIFLRESSLHPKFYSPIFFWDVESSSNYAKKLKLTGIAATTLPCNLSSSNQKKYLFP
jgi:hypothetical protein